MQSTAARKARREKGKLTRKRLTEEEKAKTELSEQLASHPQTPKSLETVINAVMLYHQMDHQTAVCALRDYFQVEVARHMDLMAARLDDEVRQLREGVGNKIVLQ